MNEQLILGLIMITNTIPEKLNESYFSNQANKILFQYLTKIKENGLKMNIVNLYDILLIDNLVGIGGGIEYWSNLEYKVYKENELNNDYTPYEIQLLNLL